MPIQDRLLRSADQLESDAGWCLERLSWSEPMFEMVEDRNDEAIEVPLRNYRVDGDESARFQGFRSFFDTAVPLARTSQTFRLASRRYIRAIQIAGLHPSGHDDYAGCSAAARICAGGLARTGCA